MGAVIANDILIDVGLALLEPMVNTTLNPAGGSLGPGIATATQIGRASCRVRV